MSDERDVMPEALRCNCMVPFDPILPPGEHADDCPCSKGVIEYRTRIVGRPHESDEAWTDRETALDELAAFRGLGAKGVRLDARIVPDITAREDQP